MFAVSSIVGGKGAWSPLITLAEPVCAEFEVEVWIGDVGFQLDIAIGQPGQEKIITTIDFARRHSPTANDRIRKFRYGKMEFSRVVARISAAGGSKTTMLMSARVIKG
jgi:hypothetical protein